jgi:hypothetical protein
MLTVTLSHIEDVDTKIAHLKVSKYSRFYGSKSDVLLEKLRDILRYEKQDAKVLCNNSAISFIKGGTIVGLQVLTILKKFVTCEKLYI